MAPFILFLLAYLVCVVIDRNHSQRERRNAGLRAFSAHKGYQFKATGSATDLGLYDEILIYPERQYRSPLRNLIWESSGNAAWSAFDYTFGTYRTHHTETVVWVKAPALSLPIFSLEAIHPTVERYYGKDSLFNKIGAAIAPDHMLPDIFGQRVKIEGDESFNELYRLEGRDLRAIQRFFESEVISLFLQLHPLQGVGPAQRRKMLEHKNLYLSIRAFRDQFVMCYPRYLSVEEVQQLLTRAQQLLHLWLNAERRAAIPTFAMADGSEVSFAPSACQAEPHREAWGSSLIKRLHFNQETPR